MQMVLKFRTKRFNPRLFNPESVVQTKVQTCSMDGCGRYCQGEAKAFLQLVTCRCKVFFYYIA